MTRLQAPSKPSAQAWKSALKARTPGGSRRNKNWKPRCAGHADRPGTTPEYTPPERGRPLALVGFRPPDLG